MSKRTIHDMEFKHQYRSQTVSYIKDKHPDMVKALEDAKDTEGKPLLDVVGMDDVLFNCADWIKKYPDTIKAVLDNPEKIAVISAYSNRAVGLWLTLRADHEQGYPANSGEYQNSGLTGSHRIINGEGETLQEGMLKDGKKDGEYKVLAPDGTVKAIKNYENGYLKEQEADGSILYIDEEKNKVHQHINKDGVDDTAEYVIGLKFDKVYKLLNIKHKNHAVTQPDNILTALAVKRKRRSQGE